MRPVCRHVVSWGRSCMVACAHARWRHSPVITCARLQPRSRAPARVEVHATANQSLPAWPPPSAAGTTQITAASVTGEAVSGRCLRLSLSGMRRTCNLTRGLSVLVCALNLLAMGNRSPKFGLTATDLPPPRNAASTGQCHLHSYHTGGWWYQRNNGVGSCGQEGPANVCNGMQATCNLELWVR